MVSLRRTRTSKHVKVLVLSAVLISFISLPVVANAWGPIGHRVIGRIAKQHLSPKAKSRLNFYFGKNVALEELATWADEIQKQRPETAPWHHLRIAPSATSLDMERDCPEGNCITAKTRLFVGIARLALRRKSDLLEPVKFIVHFGGDLHQPLHFGHSQDQHGWDIPVELNGHSMSLGEVWNSAILELNDETEEEFSRRLIRSVTPELKREWSKGTLRDWSWETHLVAIRVAYGLLPTGSPKVLDEMYLERARGVIEEQLLKGGVRLAELLNRTWP